MKRNGKPKDTRIRKPVHVHENDHALVRHLLMIVAQRGVASLPPPARAVFEGGGRRLSKSTIIGMGLAVFQAALEPNSESAA
jgi:hypothetical protein